MVHSVCLESKCASAHVGSNPTSSAVEKYPPCVGIFLMPSLGFEPDGAATAASRGLRRASGRDRRLRIPKQTENYF